MSRVLNLISYGMYEKNVSVMLLYVSVMPASHASAIFYIVVKIFY